MSQFEAVDILLAEDNPTDAELAMRALERSKLANRIVWVHDGSEALEYIFREGRYADRGKGNPKLLLLDLKMPKVDGLQVLKKVKSDPSTQVIPVVIMTSSQEECDLVESYRLGANSYIVKPVDFDQFVDAVSQTAFYWAVINKVPA